MSLREPADNPFLVLGVPLSATRLELERAGQKLLAQLTIGATSAMRYDTPLGSRERTADKVRAALAALRDPEQRVLSELTFIGPEDAPPTDASFAWPLAWRSIGWRGPCPSG